MGYNAYDAMREKNKKRWGLNGPETPEKFNYIREWQKDENGNKILKVSFEKISNLEENAIEFIREKCVDLRFRKGNNSAGCSYENLDDNDGTSMKEKQIPYNFQMDIDRRCLEVAIHRFLESGIAQDAFDVYFCYLEMFIGSYGKTKKMIEMLSEFETNASSLLMKHRDHYSHSVYVFLIGLAIFNTSDKYREAYKKSYENIIKKDKFDPDKENELSASFLKYWGLTSLFHDVGYPFELTFEQVKSYFGDTIEYVPFAAFNMNNFQYSKVGDIHKKVEKLIDSCDKRFNELRYSKDEDDYNKEKDKLEKINKKISAYQKNMEDWGIERKNLQLVDEEGEENLSRKPTLRYLEAIDYLKSFLKEIDKKKEEGINKLKAMSLGDKDENVENLNLFLSRALYHTLGEDYAYYDKERKKRFEPFEDFYNRAEYKDSYNYQQYLYEVLCKKPEHPEQFGGYIDHAYFSAITVLSTLMKVVDYKDINEMYTHAITAILLHNSLYKFSITKYTDADFNNGRHFCLSKHPLAWLLMLCDELQCWDRTSYGQNSRGEVHPFDCKFTFEENRISATYLFDRDMYFKIDKEGNYNLKSVYDGKKGTYKKLCINEEDKLGKSEFLKDIENIISINGDNSFGENNGIELIVDKKDEDNKRYRRTYLSTSNFIHMYKFAVKVHGMNHLDDEEYKGKNIENKFEKFSLEYKMNHISRAKKFSKALEKIGCFYSDKPMDCEVISSFADDCKLDEIMGPIEHERWCWEHFIMGWRHISGEELKIAKEKYSDSIWDIRECTKLHKDMLKDNEAEDRKNCNSDKEDEDKTYCGYNKELCLDHYQGLTKDDKEKDKRSYDNLLNVLSQEDGVKVYRLK